MATLLKNGFVYKTATKTFEKEDLFIENGNFVTECSEIDKTVDCDGTYIIPGLVDVHTHGRAGHDFNTADSEAVRKMRRSYAEAGTTTIMATLASATMDSFKASADAIGENRSTEKGLANIAGIHIEGRYLNPKKRGAHLESLLAPLDADEGEKLVRTMFPLPVHVSAALELDGGEEFVKRLTDIGATVALAHSDATYAEAVNAVEWGATAFTHTFNCMKPIHHREPGNATASMLMDSAYSEVICDGEHIHPAVIKLCDRAKPDGKFVLITDSMEATGCPDGEYAIAGIPVIVKNGKAVNTDGALAGSTLDLFKGLTNYMKFTGKTLEEAIPAATLNPAEEVGIEDVCGSIEPGKRADMIMIKDKNAPAIESVWIAGERI